MTSQYTLDQLSLLVPNEGGMFGLSLGAQAQEHEPLGRPGGLSRWFPKSLGLVDNARFLFEPVIPRFDNAPSQESPKEDEADNNAFLRFVDKSSKHLADDFCTVVRKANEGVADFAPVLCEQGEGGTYFLHDAHGTKIGVFKPDDEDPQGENNPKKKTTPEEILSPRVLRKTIPKGEAALREVAAYELDQGFAGVPPTRMMKAKRAAFANSNSNGAKSEDKVGSLQLFVDSEAESWDLAPYNFSITDIHRIGIFDIRSFNTDRHGGNMLAVARDESKHGGCYYDLVPIDHGFCFPTALSEANWEWLYWPQAKKPFDAETLQFIAAIDVEQDSKLLRRSGLSEEALRVNRVATLLLKKGAAAGLNLFEIAKLCMRKRFRDQEEPSPLEKLCEASEVAVSGDSAAFWAHFELALSTLVEAKR